jgi:hypothetical protein
MAQNWDSTAEYDQFYRKEYKLHRQMEAHEGRWVAQAIHRISLYFTLFPTHAPLRTRPLPFFTDSFSW